MFCIFVILFCYWYFFTKDVNEIKNGKKSQLKTFMQHNEKKIPEDLSKVTKACPTVLY